MKKKKTYLSKRKFIRKPGIGQIVKVYLNDKDIDFGEVVRVNDYYATLRRIKAVDSSRIDFYLTKIKVKFLK